MDVVANEAPVAFSSEHLMRASEVGSTRSDTQCILWCVAKYDAPDGWSEEDKAALNKWRDGSVEAESTPSSSGTRVLTEQLLIDSASAINNFFCRVRI